MHNLGHPGSMCQAWYCLPPAAVDFELVLCDIHSSISPGRDKGHVLTVNTAECEHTPVIPALSGSEPQLFSEILFQNIKYKLAKLSLPCILSKETKMSFRSATACADC